MSAEDTFTLDYHGDPVRVIMRDGEPWFVVSDVCRVLNIYMRGGKPVTIEALRRLRLGSKALHPVETSCGPRLVGITNRDGLAALALWAKRPDGPEPFVRSVEAAVPVGLRELAAA
ncbi:MAG: hypothetical protein H2055_08085 [Sphingopyxis sp.]|nr:hypothetical protein [Sphingopyxis sp.]